MTELELVMQAVARDEHGVRLMAGGIPNRPWPMRKVDPFDRDPMFARCDHELGASGRALDDPPMVLRTAVTPMHRQTWASPGGGPDPMLHHVWVGQCGDCGTILYAVRAVPQEARARRPL